MDVVRVRPAAQLAEAVHAALDRHRCQVLRLVPEAEVEHVGATAVPGALTKGDLDLLVRVPTGRFGPAVTALGEVYAIHQPHNWTETLASFIDPASRAPAVGVQLVVAGSPSDALFAPFRDLLIADPGLLREYNALKLRLDGESHERYTALKGAFVERVLATLAPERAQICQASRMADELPSLLAADAAAWRAWLVEHHERSTGVWLMLAKKGAREPTSLTYDEALDEALCHGWIDGQVRGGDQHSYRQRFTPRRPRSSWSQRNVGIALRLIDEDRMHPAGLREVERAKADGRWQAAYAGPAASTVPADLAAALAADPKAARMFDTLTSQNRYAILYRLGTAKRPETRRRRIEQFVTALAEGQTIHPQARGPA